MTDAALKKIFAKLDELRDSMEALHNNMLELARRQTALEGNQELLYGELAETSKHVQSVNRRCLDRAESIRLFLESIECSGPGQRRMKTPSSDLPCVPVPVAQQKEVSHGKGQDGREEDGEDFTQREEARQRRITETQVHTIGDDKRKGGTRKG